MFLKAPLLSWKVNAFKKTTNSLSSNEWQEDRIRASSIICSFMTCMQLRVNTLHKLINWFNDSLTEWPFSTKPSKHHYTQTVRARADILKECSPPTTCHMSGVMCQVSVLRCLVSCVRCHVSNIYIYIWFRQCGWACGWRVCYQRDLPRLASHMNTKWTLCCTQHWCDLPTPKPNLPNQTSP